MAHYIMLANFTEQGLRGIKETTKRADAFKELAKSQGVTVKDMFWTLGAYDLVAITESPDETTTMALAATLGKAGNVRFQTLRAFTQAEVGKILAKVQ